MTKDRRFYLILWFGIIFALIPILTRNVIPYDMIENLYWGKEWQCGYAKHPPLFAWISYVFFKVCGSIPESLYVLTQLNLLIGFYFIFKTALLLGFDKKQAYSAILFFMCSFASVFGNEKFNATTILMSLLPMSFYFFIRLMMLQKISDAFCLGLIASLAVLGKYFALLFFGCMGIFLLIDKVGRKLFYTPLPYIVIIVFAIGISWHIQWMIQHNFPTLNYALDKSVHASINRLSAFNFVAMMILFFGTSFAVLKYVGGHNINLLPKKWSQYDWGMKFVIFITLAPVSILFLISLFFGMRIGSFWGVNMLMLIGVYFLILNPQIDHDKLYNATKRMCIVFSVLLFLKLGIGRQIAKHYDVTEAIDPYKVAFYIENDWYNRFGKRKISVIRADKATACLHAYLKDSPSYYNPSKLDQYKIFEHYINELSLVTFLCDGQSDDKIQKFTDAYSRNILECGLIHIIDNSFIYFAFVEGKK